MTVDRGPVPWVRAVLSDGRAVVLLYCVKEAPNSPLEGRLACSKQCKREGRRDFKSSRGRKRKGPLREAHLVKLRCINRIVPRAMCKGYQR